MLRAPGWLTYSACWRDNVNMTPTQKIQPISDMNTNYDPPRPWTCQTLEPHACDGVIVGKVTPYPVCAAGAAAEIAARIKDHERVTAWANSPEGRRAIRAEAAMERRIEMQH